MGSYGFYAVMTNSLGAITNSLTNVVTVTAVLTNLTFLQQPTNAGAGVVMVSEVRVGATNSVGAAMVGIPVALSLNGSGTLGGTLTQNTDGSGIAHFTNLTVSLAGVKTLIATNAGSGVSRTSFSFTITNTTFPILVGVGGSGTNSFSSVPPVTEWSTFNIQGDHNTTRTDAQWDAAMATNSAANITSPLGNQGTAGTASLAYWRSDLLRIVTQPTGGSSAAVLLMATLRNTSGGTLNTLNVAYVMSDTVTPTTEGRKGHRVYYSVNGTNWIAVGNFTVIDGTSTNIAFAMPALAWAPDSLLYVVWLDEDGASPDGDYGIDDISFTPSTGPSVVVTQPAHGSTFNASATINLIAAASGGSGSVSNVAYYYTTNGVATCVGTSSSGPTYPVSVTGLAAGSYGFYAVMTNSLGAATKSLTNFVIARGALLLKDTFDLTSANPNTTDVNFQIAERQSGALAPVTYAKGLEPVFSQVGNSGSPFELLLAGRAAGFGGAVSLDHDFVESPDIGSSSVIEFDVNPVLICSGCNVTESSWVAVTFGSSSGSRNQFPQFVDGMGILFRGNGQYAAFNAGQTVAADAFVQNADHLFHHIRITLTETNFGNPFSGIYPVIVRAFADGNVSPFFTFVRTNGFAHNYISLIAEGEGGGGDGVVRHLVDNLTISLEPASRPELSVALSGGNAVLSWPTFATGYQIHTASNLVPPVEWSPLSNAVINCGTNFCVTVPINGPRAFFRLAK